MRLQFSLLLICAILLSMGASAAPRDSVSQANMRPVLYIGFSGGINNPSGIPGLDFNIRLRDDVTLDVGLGASTWGNKLYGGVKYHFQEHRVGWALGGGIIFNSGMDNKKARLETTMGRREVTLSLKPMVAINLSAYRYWKIGRKQNRFFVNVGYNQRLTDINIHQVYGAPITANSMSKIKRFAPGGVTLGLGFSFVLQRRPVR